MIVAAMHPLPKDAEIVNPNGDTAGDNPVGNVKVHFTDGHAEMWTRRSQCIDPKVSAFGHVGWIYCIGKNDRGWRIFGALRVVWPDEHHRDFQPYYPYIEEWDFADNDTTVIIKCMLQHGPSHYLRYRLSDGQQLDEFKGFEGAVLPDWARPLGE
jgi:hypothetical protein